MEAKDDVRDIEVQKPVRNIEAGQDGARRTARKRCTACKLSNTLSAEEGSSWTPNAEGGTAFETPRANIVKHLVAGAGNAQTRLRIVAGQHMADHDPASLGASACLLGFS
jgi:hypothetical protein